MSNEGVETAVKYVFVVLCYFRWKKATGQVQCLVYVYVRTCVIPRFYHRRINCYLRVTLVGTYQILQDS